VLRLGIARSRTARAAFVCITLLAACSPTLPVPQPVSLTGTITNWTAGTPPYEAGALAGRDALALELTPWVTGQVDAAGVLDATYAIPDGTWGAPLSHLFDDPGGAIIRYDAIDDALDLMVYVASPASVAATACRVLIADVAVDVDLAAGWNRLRLSRGEGTLTDGHDPDAVWIWD
jgi:hypothetical protein